MAEQSSREDGGRPTEGRQEGGQVPVVGDAGLLGGDSNSSSGEVETYREVLLMEVSGLEAKQKVRYSEYREERIARIKSRLSEGE